jgi:hypothetical protein
LAGVGDVDQFTVEEMPRAGGVRSRTDAGGGSDRAQLDLVRGVEEVQGGDGKTGDHGCRPGEGRDFGADVFDLGAVSAAVAVSSRWGT